MTTRDGFWFLAGLLCALAVALLALPLLRARAASQPVFRPLQRGWWLAVPLLAAVAGGLYAWLGNPDSTTAVAPVTAPQGMAAPNARTSADGGSMTSAVTKLEARLAKGGGVDADWNLLAQSYEFLARPADATLARQHQLPAGAGTAAIANSPATPVLPTVTLNAAALKLVTEAEQARQKRDFRVATAIYARLVQMQQMNADTWADFADAQASLDGKLATPQTASYISKALELAPQHNKALWLRASLQEETEQFAAAAQTFQQLVAQLPADSNDAKLITAKIAADLKLAPAATSDPRLRGEIVLADSLRARVRPGMALFVFARAEGAPGAPVAVYRTTTGSWPVKFELSNANAMVPGHDLSSAQRVVVEARISQSGQAIAQPGDLQGSSAPLAPTDARPLHIVIQKIIG